MPRSTINGTAIDLDGKEIILDADQDTTITADTDDTIDFKIAGVEHISLSNSSGDTVIKPRVDTKEIIFQQFDGNEVARITDGRKLKFFDDGGESITSDGSNLKLESGGTTFTVPSSDGSNGQFLKTDGSGALSFGTVSTGVALDDISTGDAASTLATSSGDITLDSPADINLDAAGQQIFFKKGGTTFGQTSTEATPANFTFECPIQDGDIIFKGDDGGASIEAMRIDMGDNGSVTIRDGLTLSDGDITLADGHGISFAATGDGSGTDTSELLDDYEEGTWTPAYSSTGASWSYSSQYGAYAKVGGLVYIQFYLYATVSGTSSNTVTVTGLPYAVANLNALHQGGISAWFSGSQNPNPLFNNSQTAFTLWKKGAVEILAASHFGGEYFVGSGVYRAS